MDSGAPEPGRGESRTWHALRCLLRIAGGLLVATPLWIEALYGWKYLLDVGDLSNAIFAALQSIPVIAAGAGVYLVLSSRARRVVPPAVACIVAAGLCLTGCLLFADLIQNTDAGLVEYR